MAQSTISGNDSFHKLLLLIDTSVDGSIVNRFKSLKDDGKHHEIIENFKDSIIKATQKFVSSFEGTDKEEVTAKEYYITLSNMSTLAAEEAVQEYWYHRGYK